VQTEYKLSIITVNFNGISDTCALIDSLIASQLSDTEIIIVDNGSTVDEAAAISQCYPQPFIKAIRSNENLGFAGGNNLGIKASSGEYLFFINNDTEAHDNWHPEKLIQRLESSPSIGMVCPKIRFAWGPHPLQFTGYTPLSQVTLRNRSIGFNEEDSGQYDMPHSTPYAHGAAMMVSRNAMEKAGLMPECFFLYYEELDWSMMFRRQGYEIWYDPCCTIYHKESQTTGQNSPLRQYYIARNRLLFARRNISRPQRYLTYTYLILLVGVRDMISFLLHRRFDLIGSTLSGISDFLKGRQNIRRKDKKFV
jgi:hypothetical protein